MDVSVIKKGLPIIVKEIKDLKRTPKAKSPPGFLGIHLSHISRSLKLHFQPSISNVKIPVKV